MEVTVFKNMNIKGLLSQLTETKATGLYLSAGITPMLNVLGQIKPIEYYSLKAFLCPLPYSWYFFMTKTAVASLYVIFQHSKTNSLD